MFGLAIKDTECIYNKERKNLTRKENERYKAWVDEGFIYILEYLALILIIMNCKVPTTVEFGTKLGFNQYDVMINKEQSAAKKLIKLFAKEKIFLQHSVLGYRID